MARRRKKGSTRNVILGVMLIGVFVGVLGFIGFLYYAGKSATKLDEAMCPVDGPVGVRVFLVDTTDPVSPTTLADARNRLEAAINKAAVGERLEIYALSEEMGKLTEMFAGCKPDDGTQASKWTSNPRLMKHDWEEFFAKPLAEVTGNLDRGIAGNQSPIMAAIQNIKLRVFDRFKDQDIPKKLIVLSDMIEHTPHYSQYRSGSDYDAFKQSAGYHEFRTDLTDIGVEVWFIDRGIPRFRNSAHLEFWANWVHGNRGEWQKAVQLEGVNPGGSGESR